MELVLITAGALAVYARRNRPATTTGPLDAWSYWLIRGTKPQL